MRLLTFVIAAVSLVGNIVLHAHFNGVTLLGPDVCSRLGWSPKLSRVFRCLPESDVSENNNIQLCGARLVNYAEIVCKNFGGLQADIMHLKGNRWIMLGELS